MKTTVAVLTVVLLGIVAASAADKPDAAKPKAPAQKVSKKQADTRPGVTEKVALTGTYIKRDIRRNGIVTDGFHPVVVLDSDMIANSGAADINDLLIRKGLRR